MLYRIYECLHHLIEGITPGIRPSNAVSRYLERLINSDGSKTIMQSALNRFITFCQREGKSTRYANSSPVTCENSARIIILNKYFH